VSFVSYEQQTAALDEIGATAEVTRKVFSDNFDRLFPALHQHKGH
jgi:hypothetical protein